MCNNVSSQHSNGGQTAPTDSQDFRDFANMFMAFFKMVQDGKNNGGANQNCGNTPPQCGGNPQPMPLPTPIDCQPMPRPSPQPGNGGHCGQPKPPCGSQPPSGDTSDIDATTTGDVHAKGTLHDDKTGKDTAIIGDTKGTGKVTMLTGDTQCGPLKVVEDIQGKGYDVHDTITIGNNTVEVDAKTDKVSLNGKDITQDGEYSGNGITLKKEGAKTTVTTANGTIEIVDKGNHLDDTFKLTNLGNVGGMLGEAGKTGKWEGDVSKFPVTAGNTTPGGPAPGRQHGHQHGMQPGNYGYGQQYGQYGGRGMMSPVGYGGQTSSTPRDAEWAVNLLRSLAGMAGNSNPQLSQFLTSLANLMDNSAYDRSMQRMWA